MTASNQRPITFLYTNWKGETSQRHVIPKFIEFISTEWHPEPQWIMTAFDLDKKQDRGFAMKDMKQFDWSKLHIRVIPYK